MTQFVQGDLGLSKKYGGTGLGLSICSQLAGLMRGTISLQSEVGQGSVFTMAIPLKHLTSRADSTASSSNVNLSTSGRQSISGEDPSTMLRNDDALSGRSVHSVASAPVAPVPVQGPPTFESDSKPRLVGLSQPFFASNPPLESPNSQQKAMARVEAEATQRGDKVRVLVAEDNKTNQEVVLRMLKLEDVYDVTVAKDGQEALDKVKESMERQTPYNLIFMDVQMPNLDGLQSTRLIRQSGFEAPIVALTAVSLAIHLPRRPTDICTVRRRAKCEGMFGFGHELLPIEAHSSSSTEARVEDILPPYSGGGGRNDASADGTITNESKRAVHDSLSSASVWQQQRCQCAGHQPGIYQGSEKLTCRIANDAAGQGTATTAIMTNCWILVTILIFTRASDASYTL